MGEKKKEQKVDLHDGTSSFTQRPFLLKAKGFLSVAVLAVVFIGILEVISLKFPKTSQPYKPPAIPSVSSITNASSPIVIQKRTPGILHRINATSPIIVRKRQDPVAAVSPPAPGPSDLFKATRSVIVKKRQTPATSPPAPCGMSTTLDPTCRVYCAHNEISASLCPSSCNANNIWPYLPVVCPESSSTLAAAVVGVLAASRVPPSTSNSTSPATRSPSSRAPRVSVVPSSTYNATVSAAPSSLNSTLAARVTSSARLSPSSSVNSTAISSMPITSSARLSSSNMPITSSNSSSVHPVSSSANSTASSISMTQSNSTSSMPMTSSRFSSSSVAPVTSSSNSTTSSILVTNSNSTSSRMPVTSFNSSSVAPQSSSVNSTTSSIHITSANSTSIPPATSSMPLPPSSTLASPSNSISTLVVAASSQSLVASPRVIISSALPPSASPNPIPLASLLPSASQPAASALSNLFLSESPNSQLPQASVASAVIASGSQVLAASNSPIPPIIPVANPVVSGVNSAPLPVQSTPLNAPALPVQVANNPDAPITIVVVPVAANGPSTVVINNPSVVLPLLGVQTVASSVVTTNAAGDLVTVPVTIITPIPNAPVPNSNAVVTSESSVVVTDSLGNVATIPVEVISPANPSPAPAIAVPAQNPPTVAPNTNGNGGSGSGGAGARGAGVGEVGQAGLKKATYVSTSTTFSGGYAPIIVARIAAWGWSAIHGQLNAYAPFAQMNQPGGAPGTVLLGPSVSSIWWSYAGYAAVVVLSPLAPELIYFDTNWGCSNPNLKDPANPCLPARVSTNLPILRTLEVLLGFIAVISVLGAYKSFKKPSGVNADPTSIAAVASVMGHPRVTADFAMLSGEATDKDLKEFLKTKKYKLGTYLTENGTERYGIIPVENGDASELLDLAWSPNGQQDAPAPDSASNKSSKWTMLRMWKSISSYIDGIFLLFIIGVMAICASYVKYIDRSILARLFQYSSIGRRMVFTVIGMVVSQNWSRLLSDTQTVSPYLTLSHQDAPAKRSILLPKHSTALTSIMPALFRGQNTTFLVAFTALLAEFLVVALSGLPFRPGQASDEFFFCGISALIILAIMVVVLLVINLWRRALPHLPRKPDSTGSVMTYLADGRMVKDFEGVERMKGKERDAWIEMLGNRYEYSTKPSVVTGQTKWVVDHSTKEVADVENVMPQYSHAAPLTPVPAPFAQPPNSKRNTQLSQFDYS